MTKVSLGLLLVFFSIGCFPNIPRQTADARKSESHTGSTVAPCALVHLVGEEDLSNGARGWFRGAWPITYSSFLIRHPKGVILVDAAFGNSLAADLAQSPFYFRWTFGNAGGAKTITALLAEQGLKPEDVKYVLLTHDHWDHAGGLPDLPNARVIMGKADVDWLAEQKDFFAAGAMPHDFDAARAGNRIDPLTFPGPATDGFDRSQDVFGDGTVIAVPTPGHTRGATSYFVNSADGRRWLFIGDAAWVKEGFEEPVTKGRIASLAADWNWDLTSDTLGRLHAVYEGHAADLVTSHDQRTWTNVPVCAAPKSN